MVTTPVSQKKSQVPVLIADDSIVFRRFMRDLFADSGNICICGEAKHGIEALDMVLKTMPKVILMDMEMPLMDGMTALQHLMIHFPTPTIVFSSLTAEGSFRAFDALKNGAVDFLSKDLLFNESKHDVFKRILTRKILSAAQMTVHPIEPAYEILDQNESVQEDRERVVFCEDCGARNVITATSGKNAEICQECGDVLVHYNVLRFRRSRFVTVFGGGADCFRSLLNIIPQFDAELNGSILIVIKAEHSHVDTFTEYLDAISPMKVLRAREGMTLESGFCYVATSKDHLCLQSSGAQQTLGSVKKLDNNIGPIDMAMMSVGAVYKNNCAGVLLSGNDVDGIWGIRDLLGNGGSCLVLNPTECLSSRLVRLAIEKFRGIEIADEDRELALKIAELYSKEVGQEGDG